MADMDFHVCEVCGTSYINYGDAELCEMLCNAPKCPECESNQLMHGMKGLDTDTKPARCLECGNEFDLPNDAPWVHDEMSYMIRMGLDEGEVL